MISDMIKPLRNRVYSMITRAVLETVNDASDMQLVKISLLADETRDSIERFQNYGFTSVPPPNSEAIALSVGGNRDHMVVIAVDNRIFRLKGLLNGEVAMYTDEGDFIKIKKGGIIEVKSSTKVIVNSLLVDIVADVDIKATAPTVTITSTVKTIVDSPLVELGDGTLEKIINGETFQTLFNTHTHPDPISGSSGPPTQLMGVIHLSNTVKGSK